MFRTETAVASGSGRGEAAEIGPCLYRVLDASHPMVPSSSHRLHGVRTITVGRGAATDVRRDAEGKHLELHLADSWVSGVHLRLTAVLGGWVAEDAGSRNGTLLNGKPLSRASLHEGDLLELGHTFLLFRDAVSTAPGAPDDLSSDALDHDLPGLSTLNAALAAELAGARLLARSKDSLVLFGETGTGKEVLARAMHRLSGRGGSFVAVNCGALPRTLIESELFGAKRGAFSGASEDRPGLVRSAEGGTLFLDEIGELPLDAQAVLLRFLAENEVHPVGASRPIPVDVRVIAASHRNLREMVDRGQLRADLYARLSGYTLRLPPLRERREDMGMLVASLLARRLGEGGAATASLTSEAGRALLLHDWPLNVRELEKALGAAVTLSDRRPIALGHLPDALRSPPPERTLGSDGPALGEDDVRQRAALVDALRAHRGNISAVARELGKARMQIHRWIRRYGLDLDSYRR